MFIKARKNLAAYFTTTTEDFRIQFMSPHDNYFYGCPVAPVTHVSYQKGIIQGHPGHRCPTRKALGLCSRIVFRAVISPDVSTQSVFRYYMSVKHIWGNYFWCFGVYVTQDYAKVVMPNRRNQGNFSTLHRLYLWAHCWIPVQWLISIDGFKHSNSSVSVFKGILSRFGCMIWRLNAIFDENVDITY